MSMIQLASSASQLCCLPLAFLGFSRYLMLPHFGIDISLNINLESSCSISRHSKPWKVLRIWHEQADFHKLRKCCLYVPCLTLLMLLKDFHSTSYLVFLWDVFCGQTFWIWSSGLRNLKTKTRNKALAFCKSWNLPTSLLYEEYLLPIEPFSVSQLTISCSPSKETHKVINLERLNFVSN